MRDPMIQPTIEHLNCDFRLTNVEKLVINIFRNIDVKLKTTLISI